MQTESSTKPQVFSEYLRRKRLEKKLTLEQVAERLKLSPARLEVLETITSMDELTPFERGHLRNYAALLEVDMSPFALELSDARNVASDLKSVEQQDLVMEPVDLSKRIVWTIVILLLLVASYFIVIELIEISNTERVDLPALDIQNIELESSELINQTLEINSETDAPSGVEKP